MSVVLISCYDLGKQPFGVASPAAWLKRRGARVRSLDLAIDPLDEEAVRGADLVAFHVPMHTATRIAVRLAPRVRALNPRAHLCFYGLYAPLNERLLRRLGADTILGGEFEAGLESLLRRPAARPGASKQAGPVVSLARQRFLVPDREDLPGLSRYARFVMPDGARRVAGSTQASRGCLHRCRHCPIVPVYDGVLRIVQRDVVLEDIGRQVASGAEHICFGDPDFFNAPTHSLRIVGAMHARHPGISYDVTIKIEHLLRHADKLGRLKETGCLLVTCAAESIDDRVLSLFAKGHTREDFIRCVRLCRAAGVTLNPTFVPFTPWQTLRGYRRLLELIEDLDLVEQVAPIQLAIRLLFPAGSPLLRLREVRGQVGSFDENALVHPWRHHDPRLDGLQERVQSLVLAAQAAGESRAAIFDEIRALAGLGPGAAPRRARAGIPYLTEPWYC
ncbi:MAG: CUAEP/CCAEP-tail radical SAM (seleno)protein [Acidobacteriota bacterium]